jgi:hypothetical protein
VEKWARIAGRNGKFLAPAFAAAGSPEITPAKNRSPNTCHDSTHHRVRLGIVD